MRSRIVPDCRVLANWTEIYMSDENKQDTAAGDVESRTRAKRIGSKLRQLYDEVAQENVPDEFLKILEEADDANRRDG